MPTPRFMAKRKTKAQREAEARAALRQRVEDIMEGAGGAVEYDEHDNPEGWNTADVVTPIARAIRCRLELTEVQDACLREIWAASHFETSKSLTDWLFGMGVRA